MRRQYVGDTALMMGDHQDECATLPYRELQDLHTSPLKVWILVSASLTHKDRHIDFPISQAHPV
jgi:hypothetical protein